MRIMTFIKRHRKAFLAGRIVVSVVFALGLIGLAFEWLPFGFVFALLPLALILPFFWPRQFGAWAGLLALVAVTWLASALAGPLGTTAATSLNNLAMLLLLSALFTSPATMALLIWRRDASVALMLISAVLLPMLLSILFFRAGAPINDEAVAAMSSAGRAGWITLWYPMLGICLGGIGFFISSALLVIREIKGQQTTTLP